MSQYHVYLLLIEVIKFGIYCVKWNYFYYHFRYFVLLFNVAIRKKIDSATLYKWINYIIIIYKIYFEFILLNTFNICPGIIAWKGSWY